MGFLPQLEGPLTVSGVTEVLPLEASGGGVAVVTLSGVVHVTVVSTMVGRTFFAAQARRV